MRNYKIKNDCTIVGLFKYICASRDVPSRFCSKDVALWLSVLQDNGTEPFLLPVILRGEEGGM